MTPLENLIRERIAENGPIPVSEYMELALAHPEHGYYLSKEPFGAGGDFITAPEISQVFGEIIGLWSAVAWQQMGQPDAVAVIECGPGRGTLMKDFLRAANLVSGFRSAIDLHLVETSPALREAQRASLADDTPHWHETIDALPTGPMLLVANEFLDALPIRQLIKTGQGWAERLVDATEQGFEFTTADAMKDAARNVPAALQDAVQGSVFEYSPAISAFVEAVSGRLQAETGYALIIDYGHDQSGLGDTLQAVRDHLYHPALSEPGSADLTAHVDFSAAKGIFQANNIQTFGPAGQGAFLTSLGIRERTETLCRNATADQARILRSGTDRLVAANRMGTLFRVMVAASEGLPPPPGFEAQEDIEC